MKRSICFISRFSEKIIFLMILVTSTVLITLGSNQNQIGLAQRQQQNNQTPSSLTNAQQQPTGTSFQNDNTTFSHHMAVVNGVQIHYVIGGHGYPVTRMARNMAALARNYTVIAPDLRGLGDSSKPL